MPNKSENARRRRQEVRLQQAALLLPVKLAGHAPQHVHPISRHRAAQQHEPGVISRRAQRRVNEDVRSGGQDGQAHLERQPRQFPARGHHTHVRSRPRGAHVQHQALQRAQNPGLRRVRPDPATTTGAMSASLHAPGLLVDIGQSPSHHAHEHVFQGRLGFFQAHDAHVGRLQCVDDRADDGVVLQPPRQLLRAVLRPLGEETDDAGQITLSRPRGPSLPGQPPQNPRTPAAPG